jgi:RNA polymerase sporulation-specific sigma factor
LLTQSEMRTLIAKSQAGDQLARKRMIEGNTRLVWSIVQRFASRGVELDDLFQIGCIGLMKSIDKFDLQFTVKFSTYAVPMIIGEIQRFLRDDGMIKVSRSIRELNFKIRHASDEFLKVNERMPTTKELAQILDVSVDDIVLAADAMRDPNSIYEQLYERDGDSIILLDQVRDERSEMAFSYLPLKDVVSRLDLREQMIIYLRYQLDYTQTEIAERLGISQVQVSRLEKKILQHLKATLGEAGAANNYKMAKK